MRYFYLNLLTTTILGLAISSCSTSVQKNNKSINNQAVIKQQPQKHTQNNVIPTWFSPDQSNTDDFLYGFGAAKTLKQATQNALTDMVQRLQVTVSTTTKQLILQKLLIMIKFLKN